MAVVRIFDPFNQGLWGVAITIFVICGLYYLVKAKKSDDFNEKHIFGGYASFFLGVAITRIFFFIGDLHVPGMYIGNVFYGNYDDGTILYEIFCRSGHVSVTIGNSLFIFLFERIAKRTRYLLSTMNIVFIVLLITLPFDFARFLANNITIIIHIIFFICITFLFTKWSRLEFKAVASIQLLAIAFIASGSVLDGEEIKGLNLVPLVVPPLFMLFGAFISLSPTIINPKRYSQAMNYWLLLGTLSILINISLIILFLLAFEIAYFIACTAISVFVFYSLFVTLKIIKAQRASISRPEAETEGTIDILGSFTKRRNITEEEITYHKEQKICLVCKSKVSRNIYLCPECNSLYCNRCSEAISALENACWACNAPFDPSKPVKISPLDDGEIVREEETAVKNIK